MSALCHRVIDSGSRSMLPTKTQPKLWQLDKAAIFIAARSTFLRQVIIISSCEQVPEVHQVRVNSSEGEETEEKGKQKQIRYGM